jgi:hypothetical protein
MQICIFYNIIYNFQAVRFVGSNRRQMNKLCLANDRKGQLALHAIRTPCFNSRPDQRFVEASDESLVGQKLLPRVADFGKRENSVTMANVPPERLN